MKYGIESEPEAIKKYEEQTNSIVATSGLWVNPKYPFLGCSPDGLVDQDGIIEIKSLKIFKFNTIDSIILPGQTSVPKDTISRQCFTLNDGKCELKRSHDYYYQIQMQLLVTERNFCDFILYAKNGPVSIERIFRDEVLIDEISSVLSLFWMRVIAPEIFEMRVPRNLHPFILPDCKQGNSICSPSLKQEESEEISLPEENDLHTDKVAGDDPATMKFYNKEELDIANFLACSMTNPAAKQASSNIDDLIVFPWGGITSDGIKLVNTCPVDNWLMIIFQAMVKSKKLNLEELDAVGQVISNALHLIDLNRYSDAKIEILPNKLPVRRNLINFYAGEDELFLKHLFPHMKNESTTTCNLETCPCPLSIVTASHMTLGLPSEHHANCNIVLESLDTWLHPPTARCGRKFTSQPPQDTPHFQNVSLDDSGNAVGVSWHCSGKRSYSPRVLFNLNRFLIFSVDVLSRPAVTFPANLPALTLDQVPSLISVSGQEFTFNGATLWNGSHYISVFQFNNMWLMYDGLREYNRHGTGLSYSQTKFEQPKDYYLSYLVYCI